jgi:hypothetical protein
MRCWLVGWCQIRQLLKEQYLGTDELEKSNTANKTLAEKILPQIENYGFGDKDEVFE